MAITAPRYRVEDLVLFPEDGNRYERLGGQLLATPAPTTAHQIVATRLAGILYRALGQADAYLAAGVREVWLADISRHCIAVVRRPGIVDIVTDTIRWQVPELDTIVVVDLATVFAGTI
jgi:Uma2 family endonuclease